MATLDLLERAELEVLGILPYASNATLLAKATLDDRQTLAVYKPRRGERPLWDFPSGTLCLRERAAFVVSDELGWDVVPPTVLREGPAGFGSVQVWIDENEDADVRQVVATHPETLMKIAAFDVIANNTDRKAGHLLIDTDGRLWGIDHGICFSDEPKLRTVIWAFEGDPVPDAILADVDAFRSRGLASDGMSELLNPDEIDALCGRVETLLRTKRFPRRDPNRYDVPWPPF